MIHSLLLVHHIHSRRRISEMLFQVDIWIYLFKQQIMMTRLITLLLFCLLSFLSHSQSEQNNTISEAAERKMIQSFNNLFPYILYPTDNMWTFLKLDTRNGKIWQIQFDIEGNNRIQVELNTSSLIFNDNGVCGRFSLHPTQNIYNFILIDQLKGHLWQVQWSHENEYRGIIPIE